MCTYTKMMEWRHEGRTFQISNGNISLCQLDFEAYLAAVLWDTPTSSHHLAITPTSKNFLTELQHKKIKGSIHKAQTPSVRTGKQKTPLFTRSFALTFH